MNTVKTAAALSVLILVFGILAKLFDNNKYTPFYTEEDRIYSYDLFTSSKVRNVTQEHKSTKSENNENTSVAKKTIKLNFKKLVQPERQVLTKAQPSQFLSYEDLNVKMYPNNNSDFIAENYNGSISYSDYTWDLSNVDVNDRNTSKKIFVNKIGRILIDLNSSDNREENLNSFSSFFKNQTDVDKSNLLKISELYKHVSNELLQITDVPDDAQHLIKSMSDSYMQASVDLQRLINSDKDNILTNIEKYNRSAEAIVRSILNITTYVKLNNLIFYTSEPGYIFTFIF